MYIPPLMEKTGLAKLTHDPKGDKMKAKQLQLSITNEEMISTVSCFLS
jgi:hypothetical protein